MYELVRRCLEDDHADSWDELWQLYFDVVAGPVRRMMREHYSEQDAEDVVMTITVDLLGGERDKLRSFRGGTRGELCRWFLQVAIRTTLKWIDANRRRERKLKRYAAESSLRSPGLTEAEVNSIISELEEAAEIVSNISGRDVTRLRILAGLQQADEVPTERTVRHWKKELMPRVARYF